MNDILFYTLFYTIYVGVIFSVFFQGTVKKIYQLLSKRKSQEFPIKFPDNMKLHKNKKGYYIIKNKYLEKKQILLLYNTYIIPLKISDNDYPTRIIKCNGGKNE